MSRDPKLRDDRSVPVRNRWLSRYVIGIATVVSLHKAERLGLIDLCGPALFNASWAHGAIKLSDINFLGSGQRRLFRLTVVSLYVSERAGLVLRLMLEPRCKRIKIGVIAV
jgi:hypothetical protein